MKRLGLICFLFVFAISAGCGQPGNKGGQGTSQVPEGAPQMQEPRTGPGGPGGPGGRGQFSPEDMASRQTDQIGEYVTFTEGQRDKIYQLNLKYARKMQELRSGVSFRDMSDEQRAEMRKNMDQQQADKEAEMKSILSADQMTQYQKYQTEMRERWQQRRPQ